MTPVRFSECNVVFAKDQPQYLPLPAYRADNGEVISCWRLTWRDCLKLLFTRRLWLRQLTFNTPLQPFVPQVEVPFIR